MTENLTRDQQMLLWELFTAGGQKLQGGLFKKAGPKEIGPLVASKHVRIVKRGRANLIEMQEEGWLWIADSEPFPALEGEKRVSAERRLLASLVGSVKRYAKAQGLQIQDLFRVVDPARDAHPGDVSTDRTSPHGVEGPEGGDAEAKKAKARTSRKKVGTPEPDEKAGQTHVEGRIRDAFFGLAGRPARDNVRLSALRAALPDVPRAEVDRALLAMRRSGAANLMNLDNPRDIAAEADDALTSGHATFHVIRIDE